MICVFNASLLIVTCLGMAYMYLDEKVQVYVMSVNRSKEIMCTDFHNCSFLCFIIFFSTSILMFHLLQVRTVKVTNVSLSATVQDIKEFFSFSGDIEHVEMQRFVKLVHLGRPFSFHVRTSLWLSSSLVCFSFLSSFGSGDEWSQVAYVSFKDAQGAETALLLSVSTWRP